ncbi:type II toxin-antitoxin system HicA family toxin [Calothrix sp. PCC 7507]|uniref:type II toxin-antitoxin system HicA family toxin n=1 Tax=Calothrix sp. PCC 7507 TaxID=99598 RepID=UPI00029EDBD3|nr:type II toxin-antitoxin system HicA family toxin [Calothrix sp. PCC 7507]AFY33026.1 YcfA family protein [Calothrix sp. PCC 7507]
MSERMRRMTAREVETILSQYGFQLISQRGSHRKWRNEELGLQVIVPEHRGRTLPIGTLRSILLGAKIPESEWRS